MTNYYGNWIKIALLSLILLLPWETVHSEICANYLDISEGRVAYCRTHDLTAGHATATRVVIAIHGALRGAENIMLAIQRASPTADIVIFAPQFLSRRDADEHSLANDVYIWKGDCRNDWRFGGESDPIDDKTVTSFDVVDYIVRYIIDHRAQYPHVTDIVVVGNSAGGQFVHRYAAINVVENTLPPNISMRYVVSNPSIYLYFDSNRRRGNSISLFQTPNTLRAEVPICETAPPCSFYNHYPRGFGFLWGYVQNNYGSPGWRQIPEQYFNRRVSILLGEEDNLTYECGEVFLSHECEDNYQGNTRLERGIVYYNYLNQYYERKYGMNRWAGLRQDFLLRHRMEIIPNIGHGVNWSDPMSRHHIFDAAAPARRAIPIEPRGALVSAEELTFIWYGVWNARRYQLALEFPDGSGGTIPVDPEEACENGGICIYRLQRNLGGGDVSYKWWITTHFPDGSSTNSATVEFTLGRPVAPTLQWIENRGTTSDHTPTLQWEQDSGVTHYHLILSRRSEEVVNKIFTRTEVCPCPVQCRTTIEAPLPDASTYSWTVRGRNAIGWGPFASANNFTIETPMTFNINDYWGIKPVGKHSYCLTRNADGSVAVMKCRGFHGRIHPSQDWDIRLASSPANPNKYFDIFNPDSDSCLSDRNGTVSTEPCRTVRPQYWRISISGDGQYQLMSLSTRRFLRLFNFPIEHPQGFHSVLTTDLQLQPQVEGFLALRIGEVYHDSNWRKYITETEKWYIDLISREEYQFVTE